MRLDPDCIRDILLAVEDVVDGTNRFEYERYGDIHKRLKGYSHDVLHYHFQQCNAHGLISGFRRHDGGDWILIADLTPEGHAFLANIRSNGFWNKVKGIAVKIGTPALSSILQIAENLAASAISDYFKIP